MCNSSVTGNWSINVVVTGPEVFSCHKIIEHICQACIYPNQTSIFKTAFISSNNWTAVLTLMIAQSQQHALLLKNAPLVILVGTPTDLLSDSWVTNFSSRAHRVVVATHPVSQNEDSAFRALRCSVFNMPMSPNNGTYKSLAHMCAFETMVVCNMMPNMPHGLYKLKTPPPEPENTLPENLTPLLAESTHTSKRESHCQNFFCGLWKRLNYNDWSH
jgi:hypothetical protein